METTSQEILRVTSGIFEVIFRACKGRTEIGEITFPGTVLVSDQAPAGVIDNHGVDRAINAQLVQTGFNLGRKTKECRRSVAVTQEDSELVENFLPTELLQLSTLVRS